MKLISRQSESNCLEMSEKSRSCRIEYSFSTFERIADTCDFPSSGSPPKSSFGHPARSNSVGNQSVTCIKLNDFSPIRDLGKSGEWINPKDLTPPSHSVPQLEFETLNFENLFWISNSLLFTTKWKIVSTASIDSAVIRCEDNYGVIPKSEMMDYSEGPLINFNKIMQKNRPVLFIKLNNFTNRIIHCSHTSF